jgi:ribonuclease J
MENALARKLSDVSIEKNEIRLLPLGGLGEIGMNCMILESKDDLILIDCGVLFSDLDHFGIEFAIPDFKYLLDRKDKIRGVILTHGHEDHIGAVAFLLKAGIEVPWYASNFTSLMLREKLRDYGLSYHQSEIRTIKPGVTFSVGGFKVKAESVNHSIVDAMALFIDTPAGKVIHTGDFKVDHTPYFGKAMDETPFRKAGEEGVLLLLSDSTNVERCEESQTEKMVYQSFDRLFAAAEGLTVVAMFSSNVARMAQVFELAKKQDKKIAVIGRSMEQNLRLAIEAGYIKDVGGVLVKLDDIESFQRKKVIVLSTGTQGEYRSALVRVSNGEHSLLEVGEGDQVLMSSRFIPGNEKDVGRMINNLFKQGAEVLYEATHQIHVSGHATKPELKRMIEWTKPRFFLPIHGEYRHLVFHAKLAEETGMHADHILVATNGNVIQIAQDRFEKVYEFPEEPRTFVDGSEANVISKDILRERRRLGETGVVFILYTQDPDTGNVVAGPQIVFRGVGQPEMESRLYDECLKIVSRLIRENRNRASKGEAASADEMAEEIRVEIRRHLNQVLGKKVVVIPYILEL